MLYCNALFFLFSECDHEQAEFVPLGQADVAVYSRTSPDKETPNEDCAAVVPIGKNRAVLAVADGAGGYRSGAKASKIACLLYTSPSPRDQRGSRMPSSA